MTATTKPLTDIVKEAKEAQFCASLVFPFDPVPASRPRVTRWGTYHTKTYKAWLTEAARTLASVSLSLPETPLAIVATFVCPRAKTSKLVTPKGDLDNYIKAPLDAITHAGLWPDDKWITFIAASKRFASPQEQPHTALHIYRLPCV